MKRTEGKEDGERAVEEEAEGRRNGWSGCREMPWWRLELGSHGAAKCFKKEKGKSPVSFGKRDDSSEAGVNLLHHLVLEALSLNMLFVAVHVPGVKNSIMDTLSRFQWEWLRTLAPEAEEEGKTCLSRLVVSNVSFIVRDIEGPPKLIDGKETTLYYTVDHCPEDLSVTWLMRRAGQVQEIQTSQMKEESLLDPSYVIRSQREGRQYVTSLSFIPHMERHKDVTLICRCVNNQHNDEKMFHCKTIYVKPRLSQPVMRSLFIYGEMKYLLNLENFYPKSIRITWRCGVGESEDLISSTESLADNPDRTYSVSSEVRIPEDRHKDPGFTVRVTWEHESMQRPESRELSIRDSDYRWSPIEKEIQIPRLVHGVPAVLQCDISGYFPDAIIVIWLRRVGQQLYEETDHDANQSVISWIADDNTYSCTARLTITPTLGEEYICMVDHPALETPIKKSTGKLQVTVKPRLSQPVMRSLCISSGMKYLLNLENFYPKSIRITWRCGVGGSEDVISSTESLADNPDRTYSVSSEVRIPEDRHKDPGFTVRVTWEHESMESPESRELSIRDPDYRWRPVVGEIQIPRLVHGVPAVLQCDISGYFPVKVTVIWWRGDEFMMYENADGAVNQNVTSMRAADNTYSCTAHLTITPTLAEDQGAEYMCVVNHPALEKPIEKCTGKLQVTEERNTFFENLRKSVNEIHIQFFGNRGSAST
ncbi:uncharacterized protein [Eleutherodactylus coqui]|uniref:uncharacterized protein n=1 Tax=Eleutherodactylus coqui TaxID=57060 RepID=UPI0034633066